ncbi:MAG: alcohol dehydrogenase catalytic domain-containing protein [Solirubrobacterales bacterium]
MRAAQYDEPKVLTMVDLPEPEAGPGQIVLEVAACGVCGSDLHSFERGFAAAPGQVLGHEFSGRVTDPSDVEGISEGQRVTVRPLTPCLKCDRCLAGDWHLCGAGSALNIGYGTNGAFAEKVLVPKAIPGMTVFPLPDSVDDQTAALVEPLAVSLRATTLAKPQLGDVAVVFGLGMIGLGAVRWLAMSGARVLAVDLSGVRRDAALKLGAEAVIDPVAENTVERVVEVTGPGGYGMGAAADIVVECSGAAPAFGDAIKVIRHGGRMSVAAMYPERVTLRPDRFVEKELEIHGSFAYKDEFGRVVDLMEQGAIDSDLFISHTFGLEDTLEAFHTQLDKDVSLKVMVEPERN